MFAVWTPMLPGDSVEAAVSASSLLENHATAQFYDADGVAGRAISTSLGADGQIAWDMYLAYAGEASWPDDKPSLPLTFAHQLGGSWADQSRYFTGVALIDELAAMVRLVTRTA